nr:putative plasmid-associated DNA primase [Eudorina cylindrica]QKN19296.1 putative plasmid-associated DNA primase [Eudorina cylindrica]
MNKLMLMFGSSAQMFRRLILLFLCLLPSFSLDLCNNGRLYPTPPRLPNKMVKTFLVLRRKHPDCMRSSSLNSYLDNLPPSQAHLKSYTGVRLRAPLKKALGFGAPPRARMSVIAHASAAPMPFGEAYQVSMVGNAEDFKDFSRPPVGPPKGREVLHDKLGEVTVYTGDGANSTLRYDFVAPYLSRGLELYRQVLTYGKPSTGPPSIVKCLVPRTRVALADDMDKIMGSLKDCAMEPTSMLSVKLKRNTGLVIVDIDCNKWSDGKQAGYRFVRSLFNHYGWGICDSVGPLLVETPRGFHLTFTAPPGMKIPAGRDVQLGIGIKVELIAQGLVAIASPIRQVLYNPGLDNVPQLPTILLPPLPPGSGSQYVSTDKLIAEGTRFNTLRQMIDSKQIRLLDELKFVHEYLCVGQLDDREYQFLAERLSFSNKGKQAVAPYTSKQAAVPGEGVSVTPFGADLREAPGYSELVQSIETNPTTNGPNLHGARVLLDLFLVAQRGSFKDIAKYFISEQGRDRGLARHIAFYTRGLAYLLLYNLETQTYLAYNPKKGIWEPRSRDQMLDYVSDHIAKLGIKEYNTGMVAAKVLEYLRYFLEIDKLEPRWGFATARGFVSYSNGRLEPHSPYNFCMRYLDHDVSVSEELSPLVKEWLLNLADNNMQRLLCLRYYLYNNFFENTRAQQALWMYGPPNSGKSTFLKLLTLLIGEDMVYTLSATLLRSDFFLQQVGPRSHIILPDFKASELPPTLTELIRVGVGGDDLSYSPKHSPEVRKKKGGVLLTVTSNTLPNLRGDSLQAQRRILWLLTGGFRSDFVGVNLEEELARNLPAFVSWLQKTPTQLHFISRYSAAVSAAINPTAGWCSVTDFIVSNRDKFLIHPKLSAPMGVRGTQTETSVYEGYIKHCDDRNIPRTEVVSPQMINEVLTEVFSRTFGCNIDVKHTRNGTNISGIKFHAAGAFGAVPSGARHPDVLVPLHVGVILTLDPFADYPIPLYCLPPQFAECLYQLRVAMCPTAYDRFAQLRSAYLEGQLDTVHDTDDAKPVKADSFTQLLANCPRLLEAQITNVDDFIKVHQTRVVGSTEKRVETLPPPTGVRKAALASIVNQMEEPLIPLSVLQTIWQQKLSPDNVTRLKDLWDQDKSKWDSFWHEEGIKGVELVLQPGSTRILVPKETVAEQSEGVMETTAEQPEGIKEAAAEQPEGISKETLVGLTRELNVTAAELTGVSSDTPISSSSGTKASVIVESMGDTRKGGHPPAESIAGAKDRLPLRSERLVHLIKELVIPHRMLKVISGKAKERVFSWESRVLQRLGYFLALHVSNNTSKCYSWAELKDSLSIPYDDTFLTWLVDKLDESHLLDWGSSNNILSLTTGLAYLSILPEEIRPEPEVLKRLDVLNISFKPENPSEIAFDLQSLRDKARAHAQAFTEQSPPSLMPCERVSLYQWNRLSDNYSYWKQHYTLLANFLNTNSLARALNEAIGHRTQVAFDLTSLLTGEAKPPEQGAGAKSGGLDFFEKRMQVAKPFATQYVWEPNNPGRWDVTGTNYLTFRADFRQAILRAWRMLDFMPDYSVASVDITGCHLGVALAILGPSKAPRLWEIFEKGSDQWEEGRKLLEPGAPYYKKDLKACFYSVLNGGSPTLEGIKRHVKRSHEGQGRNTPEDEFRLIVASVAKHPFITELIPFQETLRKINGGIYVPISDVRIKRYTTVMQNGLRLRKEATYKYASPIFCAWESIFVSKVTGELSNMTAGGYPIYILANMHDGVLVVHHQSLSLKEVEAYVNIGLGLYSRECLGLALRVSAKAEPS